MTMTEKICCNAKILLLDIEGTTTSIEFVKDTLFPFARKGMFSYINENFKNEEFQNYLKLVKEQHSKDSIDKLENLPPIVEGDGEVESIVNYLLWQMDRDRKTTCLKKIQGSIWKQGYYSGKLKGNVYDDVPLCLKKWKNDGKSIYVYSSGSVEAQKLIFGFSTQGNLLHLFSNHFDTEFGPKIDPASYVAISKTIPCDPGDILFLTDSEKEAEAADIAGCNVVLLERPGNAPLSPLIKKKFKCIRSFNQLNLS